MRGSRASAATVGRLSRCDDVDQRQPGGDQRGPAGRRARARPRARAARTRSRCAACARSAAARRRRRSRPPRRSRSRPSVACGRSSNSGARNAPVSRISPAATSAVPAGCGRPRRSAAIGLARAAGLDEARREPGERVRAADRHEVAVGVDVVAVLRRDRARDADRLGAQDHHAERGRRAGRRGRASRRPGPPGRAAPTGRSPTTSTPWSSRPSSADTAIASTSTMQRRRAAAARAAAAGPAARCGRAPTASVQPWIVVELAEHVPRARSKNSPLAAPARRAGSAAWPIAIVSPSPNRKPVITGLETRSETRAEPQQRRRRSAPTRGDERERGRQRREAHGVAVAPADRRRRPTAPTSRSSRSR